MLIEPASNVSVLGDTLVMRTAVSAAPRAIEPAKVPLFVVLNKKEFDRWTTFIRASGMKSQE
jgi:hypothetical protein